MNNETINALLKAKALTEAVTPLKSDCGRTCGHACCLPDETGRGGMLLFPGEETLYQGISGFTLTPDRSLGTDGWLLTCNGPCKREERPLSCRIFPLLPKANGKAVRVVRDRRGFWVCPLLSSGLDAFRPDFIEAVRAAGDVLYRSEAHRDFLDRLHGLIARFTL